MLKLKPTSQLTSLVSPMKSYTVSVDLYGKAKTISLLLFANIDNLTFFSGKTILMVLMMLPWSAGSPSK